MLNKIERKIERWTTPQIEPWEAIIYTLAGITRLCARCKRRPLEKDDRSYTGHRKLSRHCATCWNKCKEIFDTNLKDRCGHFSAYYINPPYFREDE